MGLDPRSASSYLAFRYLARREWSWRPGLQPSWPEEDDRGQVAVSTPGAIRAALSHLLAREAASPSTALLLSGGIDSAILAALLPPGTRAYTVRFHAPGALDESVGAAQFATRCGLSHRVVTVTWEDHLAHIDALMRHKRSPLHPAEVGLHLAARAAAEEGATRLVIGTGADSTFGGLDQLLSRDWTFEEFVQRYTFLDPALVLDVPVSMREIFEEYRRGACIDVQGFLKEVHGRGISQAFANAASAAGCSLVEPYEALHLDAPLDLERIRRGESKYLLRALFAELYPELALPPKVAFARPMDEWLASWRPYGGSLLRADLPISQLTGEQRWLLFCLERFERLVVN